MGIGNTAAASLITHCLTGTPLAECIGRGTGLDDAGLARKQVLLETALKRYRAAGGSNDPLVVQRAHAGHVGVSGMVAGSGLARIFHAYESAVPPEGTLSLVSEANYNWDCQCQTVPKKREPTRLNLAALADEL